MATLSEEYREMNRRLHEKDPHYGAGGHRYAPSIMKFIQAFNAETVLDYGCGKGTLAAVLRANGLDCREYDPAVEGKDAPPEPADFVYCGDVAEHVEPEYVDAFLDDLQRVTKKHLYLVIATRPALKVLDDGRNAHILVRPLEWWYPKLIARFNLSKLSANAGEISFIGAAK